MIVRFRKAAAVEAQYEQRRGGLGVKELRSSVEAIRRGATSFPLIAGSADIRQTLMSRFPYGVFFLVRDDVAFVIAVAHLRREPGYWKGRFRGR